MCQWAMVAQRHSEWIERIVMINFSDLVKELEAAAEEELGPLEASALIELAAATIRIARKHDPDALSKVEALLA